MVCIRWISLSLLFLSTLSSAQQPGTPSQPTNPTQKIIVDPQVVVVTGSFQPIPLSEANRAVKSVELQKQPLLYDSLIEPLLADPSIDLEERAPGGVQADLSIRGATFEQSLVLVNGLRMNDAQTGHHDMDLPFPLEAVSRIEILHGSGSTLYGADAMGGAVNLHYYASCCD
jgi:outer membrane cobalamin receptor